MAQPQKSVEDLQQSLKETAVPAARQPTVDELHAHIGRYQEDPGAHHHSLRKRLEAALGEFDADHPDLAAALRLAIYDLSNAGV